MAYHINTHILKQNFDIEKIRTLSKDAGFYVYRLPEHKETFIDIDAPWHNLTPMEAPHTALNTLSDTLAKVDAEHCAKDSFNRTIVLMNMILSARFNSRLLSIDTDDDLRNLTMESNRGELVKLRCLVGDLEIVYTGAKVQIYPMIIEDEDTPLIDLSLFDNDDFVVHAREREDYYNLHEVAIQEVRKYLNTDKTVIDLGEWDATNYEHTVLYRRTAGSDEEEINEKALRPKWKFW